MKVSVDKKTSTEKVKHRLLYIGDEKAEQNKLCRPPIINYLPHSRQTDP